MDERILVKTLSKVSNLLFKVLVVVQVYYQERTLLLSFKASDLVGNSISKPQEPVFQETAAVNVVAGSQLLSVKFVGSDHPDTSVGHHLVLHSSLVDDLGFLYPDVYDAVSGMDVLQDVPASGHYCTFTFVKPLLDPVDAAFINASCNFFNHRSVNVHLQASFPVMT